MLGKDQVLTCLPDGSVWFRKRAAAESASGVCAECYPGTKQCDGDWAQTCGAAGLWEDTQNCLSLGGECSNGTCSSACGATGKLSNEGCDYWVVDMDNKGAAADSPYAVIVSNLNTTPVSVTVSAQAGAGQAPATVASGTVAPGDLEIFQLPQQNMGETGIFWKAARVEATGPIVAYQFNPLENVDVFSNDASLLLPSNTFGTEYIVVSREEIPSDKYGAFRGSVSIVATSAETEVTVVPSAPIRAGSTVPALAIGQSHTVVLQPYQVLNLQSDALGSDLTGTIVTSTKPVAVFGGHEAAVGDQQCCADHLEQQLFPVSTWGKN